MLAIEDSVDSSPPTNDNHLTNDEFNIVVYNTNVAEEEEFEGELSIQDLTIEEHLKMIHNLQSCLSLTQLTTKTWGFCCSLFKHDL